MACAPAEREREARPRPPRPPPPNLSTSTTSTITSFAEIQKLFNSAHHHVQRGLSLDEEGKLAEAKEEYVLGLQRIQQAMAIDCENVTLSTDEKNSLIQIQQKLTKTRLQIEYRIQAIDGAEQTPQTMTELGDELESPPSYEEAMSGPVPGPSDSMMMSLGDSIMTEETQNGNITSEMNANRIYEIADGVQIFFITPEGYVSAPSYPSSLSMYKFRGGTPSSSHQAPPSFLQVNEWVYPLIPGTSPALKTSYGAYMFPDTASDVPGAAVGLMLPDNLSAEEKNKFEQLLRSLTVMEEQPVRPAESSSSLPAQPVSYPQLPREEPATAYPQLPREEPATAYPRPQVPSAPVEQEPTAPPLEEGERDETQPKTTSGKISKGIIVAADWISWGVGKGAEKAGKLIKFGSEKLQERMRPEENPKAVDPKVQKGAMYARQATNVAVRVSSFVVGKLSDATAALGRQLAPHVRKQGEKILPQLFKPSKDGHSKFDGVLEVAASGLKGFGTVYIGLETSAKALAKNLANETVSVVNHKYGSEAGKLTENTLYSVGNVAMTAYNADNIGVKAIAKRAAKDTGKAVLHDLQAERAAKREGVQKTDGDKQQSPSSDKTHKM